ncbi:uncharacterized protein HMF8227_00962 [Saliniradius amylolyticus]|uniref:Zinc ribbon-containing protein n=1 Tax=Saliniradius amylolyticus TaxID=2183582 RepID=A0A2S2E1D1_9ALTE|nr:hypothetical protein [Saliniradius amylolyticus]AWL11455.1 uncharacterized protein HMF8227_00962 [Saliniradius amylolyticus]
MQKQAKNYQQMLENLTDWVKKSVEQDVLSMMEIEKEAKAWIRAAKGLTEEEMEQLEYTLSRDLQTFASEMERDADESPWWQQVKADFWETLVSMADKNQLAMNEFKKDVEHHGIYRVGELVALGELECTSCGHRYTVTYAEPVHPCIECGNNEFARVLKEN